jgi:hypothetical protein
MRRFIEWTLLSPLWVVDPNAMRLRTVAMRCLLRPVPTYRHAAPPSCATAGVVGKKQRAGMAVAGLHD